MAEWYGTDLAENVGKHVGNERYATHPELWRAITEREMARTEWTFLMKRLAAHAAFIKYECLMRLERLRVVCDKHKGVVLHRPTRS
jgi:hypothetical protein